MRGRGPTSDITRETIALLRKVGRANDSRAWLVVAEELESPTRQRAEVNLSKIERYANEGEMVVVPGAVLGWGKIRKKVKVAALRFSKSAREKLLKAGCEVLTLKEAAEINPEARGVRIMR